MSKSPLDPVPVQIERFERMLQGKLLETSHPAFQMVIQFLRSGLHFSAEQKRTFSELVCSTFGFTPEDLTRFLVGEIKSLKSSNGLAHLQDEKDQKLLNLLPSGFFTDYVRYNSHTEVPISYNAFCALVLVGIALGRRCWFEMGPFRVYPPQGIGLTGPSGLKKTTAGDIALQVLISANLCAVYSEKITPEALVEAMSNLGAQGLIYAPEAAVLMGKQKYNEGLIPLVTRLMDCPSYISTGTISRSITEVKDVACSVIFCSTEDWLADNVPKEIFTGGFMPRFILVQQLYCSRVIAIPKVTSYAPVLEFGKFLLQLKSEVKGELSFTSSAELRYVDWYAANKEVARHPIHEAATSYFQRKPIHLIRTATNLHVASCQTKKVCEECLERAIALLLWNEEWLPSLYEELFRTPQGKDQAFVLKQIQISGGVISHHKLMQKVQYKMNSQQLKQILGSLKEAKQVEEVSNSLEQAWKMI